MEKDTWGTELFRLFFLQKVFTLERKRNGGNHSKIPEWFVTTVGK